MKPQGTKRKKNISNKCNKNKNKEENRTEDQISLLPDDIIHKIISLLPTRYATTTSILSRRWYSVWSTFPIITLEEQNHLDQGVPICPDTIINCRERFVNHLEKTLSSRLMNNAEELRISTMIGGANYLYDLVDRFLSSSLKGTLKTLYLKFSNEIHLINQEGKCIQCYKLPKIIFSHGSSLGFLSVEGCCFMDDSAVNFQRLEILSLKNTHIEDQFLQNLIHGCPVMKSLSLRCCHRQCALNLSHPTVRHLVIDFCYRLEKISIEAPNLQTFKFKGRNSYVGNVYPLPFHVNASSFTMNCYCLTVLSLGFLNIRADAFNLMVSSSQRLEKLKVKSCTVLGRARILGKNLKSLVIKNCLFYEKLKIEADNIHSLTFDRSYNCYDLNSMEVQNLRILSMHNIPLSGEDLQLMISYCPLLESLFMKTCSWLKNITIFSPSLEYLVIDDCSKAQQIRILATRMLYFRYCGPALKFFEMYTNQKLTVELYLKLQHESDDYEHLELANVRDFLQCFSCFSRFMTLICNEAEFIMMPEDSRVPPPFDHLSYLKVQTKSTTIGLVDSFCNILHISVCHETVCIDLNSSTIDMEFQQLTEEERRANCNSPSRHDCVQDHLVEAHVKNFGGDKEEIELLEFLLCNARQLRILDISINKEKTRTHRSRMIARVSNLPKVSPICKVMFS